MSTVLCFALLFCVGYSAGRSINLISNAGEEYDAVDKFSAIMFVISGCLGAFVMVCKALCSVE
jgi:hypothetical protein